MSTSTTATDLASLKDEIDLTSGMALVGNLVRPDKFIGTIPLGHLLRIAGDPVSAEDPKKLAMASEEDRVYAKVRATVQRAIEGNKRKNIPIFAEYIAEGIAGERGQGWSLPPITLYSQERLPVTPVSLGFGLKAHFMTVPYGWVVVVIDGETQYIAMRRLFMTPEAWGLSLDELRNMPVAVEFYHGLPQEAAEQIFHDRNTLEVKPNASVSMAMDTHDPGTRLVRYVMSKATVPLIASDDYQPIGTLVETSKRQVAASSGRWFLMTSMRALIVCTVTGPAGMAAKNSYLAPDLLPKIDESDMQSELLDITQSIFRRFADHFATHPSMLNRPATMAAVGVVASRCTSWYRGQNPLTRVGLIDLLSGINWSPEEQYWGGIGGKTSAKGLVTSGGPKESGRRIVHAIENPDSVEGRKIRGSIYTGGSTASAYSD